jgi:hypothetical protein
MCVCHFSGTRWFRTSGVTSVHVGNSSFFYRWAEHFKLRSRFIIAWALSGPWLTTFQMELYK